MRRLIRTATFWIALMIPAASLPIHAAEHQRPAILVLFGGDSSQLWNRDIGDGVNDAVLKQTTDSPVLYFEYVDLIRFPESAVAERLAAALREKYEGRRLDLIVTVTPAVNDFAALWRARLWPDAPVLFTSYTETVSERVVAAPQSSGLSLAWGSADALTSLQQVLPGLKRVALIAGTSALERTGRVVYLDEIRRHGLDALDMTGTSVSDMLPALAHLPDHSAVMITGLVDADGQMVPAWSLCQLVSQAANAPTVMLGSQFLGCGIMGGRMRDFRTMGALIGERAMAMLAGREFVNTFVPFARISTLAFDARQLERFNIDEGRLPPGSVVSFRRPNLWRDYGRVIASGLAAIALEAALIVGLVYERRQRIKAETDSRRHLSLAAHADRREAMSALAGSMAHELAQPLATIRYNAEAGTRLIAANRASVEDLREIFDEISRDNGRAADIIDRYRAMLRNRAIEQKPLDLNAVVLDSLRFIAHDAQSRQVTVVTQLADVPCAVNGDRILLQQVVVNLVVNAMDAMATVDRSERQVIVRSAIDRRGLLLTVTDRGTGLDEAVLARLFEPFVTTKPTGIGIGLTITSAIIEAHGGRIEAHNNSEAGATFSVLLPAIAADLVTDVAVQQGGAATSSGAATPMSVD